MLNVVSTKVAYRLYRVHLAANLNLVALHGLLNGCADVANANVNASSL